MQTLLQLNDRVVTMCKADQLATELFERCVGGDRKATGLNFDEIQLR